MRVKDWLPTLERALAWNTWFEEERLIQLPGHLKGIKVFQEWKFLSVEVKATWKTAVTALKGRLDPGNVVLAAQEFRNAMQGESHAVSCH